MRVLQRRQLLMKMMMDYDWYIDGASVLGDQAGKCLNFETSYNDGQMTLPQTEVCFLTAPRHYCTARDMSHVDSFCLLLYVVLKHVINFSSSISLLSAVEF